MAEIVITEFMDESTVRSLSGDFDVIYEPDLADRRDRLMTMVADVSVLIVRNRTIVDTELLTAARELQVVGCLGGGIPRWTTSDCANTERGHA